MIGSWPELYTSDILLLTKNRQRFFFCLLLKEMWICFNHNIVWQLLHNRPVLCLNILPPSHSVHFQNWPLKITLLRKLSPPPSETPPHWDVINNWALIHATLSYSLTQIVCMNGAQKNYLIYTWGCVGILPKGNISNHACDHLTLCKCLNVSVTCPKLNNYFMRCNH